MSRGTRLIAVLLGSVALAASSAQAVETVYLPDWRPAATAVAGTEAPFVLTVDGNVIRQDRGTVTDLKLNGRLIRPRADAQGEFYARTEDSRIDLAWKGPDLREGQVSIRIPTLDDVTVGRDNGSASFRVSPASASVTVDGVALGAGGIDKAVSPAWFRATHLVELHGKSLGESRVYSLRFDEYRALAESHERDQRLGFVFGSAPGGSGGPGIAYAMTWAQHVVGAVIARYGTEESTQSNSSGSNTYKARSTSVSLRLGLKPWIAGPKLFDLRRIEAGVSFDEILVLENFAGSSGPASWDNSYRSLGLSAGPYLRFEPIRWRWLGAAINFQRSAPNPKQYSSDVTVGFFELAFHW